MYTSFAANLCFLCRATGGMRPLGKNSLMQIWYRLKRFIIPCYIELVWFYLWNISSMYFCGILFHLHFASYLSIKFYLPGLCS